MEGAETNNFIDSLSDFFVGLVPSLIGFIESASGLAEAAPLDLLIIGGTFFVLIFLSFQLGKESIVSLILSLYVTLLLYLSFPYTDLFSFFGSSETGLIITNLLIFAILLFIIYKIMQRLVASSYPQDSLHTWFEVIVLSVVATSLILAFVYHALPIAALYDFSAPVDRFFASETLFFWWLAIPLIAMFFVIRNRY